MNEQFKYGDYTLDQIEPVLEAYRRTKSCEKTSLQEGVNWSMASVARIITRAQEYGLVEKNPTGRPRVDRERVLEYLNKYPQSTIAGIARLLGCSQATVFRAKRGE